MATGGGSRAIIAAFLANAGIAVAKFIGFLVTSSSSMLAESVHSVADAGNQSLLLLGKKRSTRAPTVQHEFGYGRERYFWSFIVALVLFTLGAVFSIYEGIHKLQHPEQLESAGWAIGILLVAVALEGLSLRTAVAEANLVREGEGWWAFIRHSRSPELPVVLLEDLGALVGLVLALCGVGLTIVTDDPMWDALGTISIGTLLAVIAVTLAVEMKSLLIGESAKAGDRSKIVTAIEEGAGVVRLIHLRTLHLGPDHLLVAAKVDFDRDLSVAGLADAINAVEATIRDDVATARTIVIEPDITR